MDFDVYRYIGKQRKLGQFYSVLLYLFVVFAFTPGAMNQWEKTSGSTSDTNLYTVVICTINTTNFVWHIKISNKLCSDMKWGYYNYVLIGVSFAYVQLEAILRWQLERAEFMDMFTFTSTFRTYYLSFQDVKEARWNCE